MLSGWAVNNFVCDRDAQRLRLYGMAKKIPSAISKYMADMGRKGGKAGAKKRTPQERSEKARRAAAARWKKKEQTN